MKVLMISPEAGSWKEHSTLAEVVNHFADAYERKGAEVLVISPFFDQRLQDQELFTQIHSGQEQVRAEPYTVWTDGQPHHRHIRSLEHFDRSGIYHDPEQRPYTDNHLRFSFLVSAALDHCQRIGFQPDFIHAHEWAAGLTGALAKGAYASSFAQTPVLLTLHNVAYDFYCPEQDIESIGLPRVDFNIDGYEYWGKVSLLKSSVLYSDQVILTSPGYLAHVLRSDLPGGIRGFLERHAHKLVGIQNGLDYGPWAKYSDEDLTSSLATKQQFKDSLRAEANLPSSTGLLLYSHLDQESGRTAETLSTILSNIIHLDMQLVVGIDESHPDFSYFRSVAEQNPEHIGLVPINSDNTKLLRHLAGSDVLFSAQPAEPSASLILKSLACGTLPLTSRETGCASLLVSYTGENPTRANALVSAEPAPDQMVRLLRFAVDVFIQNPEDWNTLVGNAKNFRYPWDTTIAEYLLTLPSSSMKGP